MSRFQCIITYRSARSSEISSWKTEGRGEDHLSVAADSIEKLKRRQRRRLQIIGVMVHDRDAVRS